MTAEQWREVKSILEQALEQPAATRGAWLQSNCPEDQLRTEVLSLLEAQARETRDFLETPADGEGGLIASLRPGSMIGQRIGSWLLVEEIGQGGMGTVYRAVRADREFDREVAIKIVSRGMDTEMLLRRFRTERQILANLDHPYIARLIDGGTTPSGLPYFVMEYVPGVPVTEYCNQNRLGIRARLELFQKICSAVAYAHHNLIVHRDLKPANVLVTAVGDPKLLDFGIARLLSDGEISDPTVTMARMATPAYASPEQIRGGIAGIPSDIYSLGVMLYEVLTGHRPYRLPSRESSDLARIICERDPTRPSDVVMSSESVERSNGEMAIIEPASISRERNASGPEQLRRKLKGDLDNIIAMALRKEPHRRYESVEQFREDLRRHLAGLPISARKDTFGYRSAKFLDRHRWSVSALVLSVLMLVAVSLWALHQASRLAHRVEEDHKLATSFVVDLHDSIAKLPGAAQARETLLQRSLRYLNGLSSESGRDPEYLRSVATAYEKFAELQVGRNGPGIGRSSDARDTYERARAIRESLVESHSDDSSMQLELARNYLLGAYIAGRTAPLNVRRELDEKALKVAEKLVAQDPRDVYNRRVLASAHMGMAYGLINEEHWDLARVQLRKAQAILTELAAEDPRNIETRQELAEIHYRLGNSYVQAGQAQQGVNDLRQALEYQTQLEADLPENPKLRSETASTCHFLGVALGNLGRRTEAVSFLNRAIAIRTASLEADPRDSRTQSLLAGNYSERAKVLLDTGRNAEALSSARRAVELQEQVFAKDGKSIPVRISRAEYEGRLASACAAMALRGKASSTEALEWYRRSLSDWDELNGEGVLRGPNIQSDIAKLRREFQNFQQHAP